MSPFFNYLFISALIGYIPLAVENMIYQIRLMKEGYNYNGVFPFIKDILKPILNGIVSLIPVLNIYRGIKSIRRLFNIENSYAEYKLDHITNYDIYKEGETEESKTEELLLSLAKLSGKNEEAQEEFKKVVEITTLLEFLEEKNFNIDLLGNEFDNKTTDEKLNYLRILVDKYKSNDEEKLNQENTDINSKNKQRISYLYNDKRDSNQDETEMKLRKRKNKK